MPRLRSSSWSDDPDDWDYDVPEDQIMYRQPHRAPPRTPYSFDRVNTDFSDGIGAKNRRSGNRYRVTRRDALYGQSRRRRSTRWDGRSLDSDYSNDSDDEDSIFRCHSYHTPLGGNGAGSWDIWMEVPIRISADNDKLKSSFVGTWRWPQNPGAGHVGAMPIHLCHVAAAKSWTDAEGQHRLDLTTVQDFANAADPAASPFRWLHVETDKLDFDEYQTIALNTPDLSRDWKIVILSLLKRIRKEAQGHDENNWNTWSMRADSAEITMPKKYKTSLTAISASFPYFAVGKKDPSCPPSTHKFAGAGLFEMILDRNFEQSLPKMVEELGSTAFIYTAHVWSLQFDKSELKSTPRGYEVLC